MVSYKNSHAEKLIESIRHKQDDQRVSFCKEQMELPSRGRIFSMNKVHKYFTNITLSKLLFRLAVKISLNVCLVLFLESVFFSFFFNKNSRNMFGLHVKGYFKKLF